MDRIAPLSLLLMVYFVIGSLSKSAKKLKKQQTGSARQAQPKTPEKAQPARPAGAGQGSPAQMSSFGEGAGHIHRGADGTLHLTERRPASQGTASMPSDGRSVSEGDDPCHEYMLDDPVLPGCPDEEPAGPAPAVPGLSLRFNRDALLNAVVMSEILKRPGAGNRR